MAGRPWPALTNFCNNRRQESVPFVSKVRPGGPSRLSVHGRPHGPLWWTFATIGVRNPCRLFEKSLPAARHGQPSTARSDELLQQAGPGIRAVCFKSPPWRPVTAVRPRPTPRPALVDFCNNRREESVPFVSKVNPSCPSQTSVTARSHELLKQTAPHTAARGIAMLRVDKFPYPRKQTRGN